MISHPSYNPRDSARLAQLLLRKPSTEDQGLYIQLIFAGEDSQYEIYNQAPFKQKCYSQLITDKLVSSLSIGRRTRFQLIITIPVRMRPEIFTRPKQSSILTQFLTFVISGAPIGKPENLWLFLMLGCCFKSKELIEGFMKINNHKSYVQRVPVSLQPPMAIISREFLFGTKYSSFLNELGFLRWILDMYFSKISQEDWESQAQGNKHILSATNFLHDYYEAKYSQKNLISADALVRILSYLSQKCGENNKIFQKCLEKVLPWSQITVEMLQSLDSRVSEDIYTMVLQGKKNSMESESDPLKDHQSSIKSLQMDVERLKNELTNVALDYGMKYMTKVLGEHKNENVLIEDRPGPNKKGVEVMSAKLISYERPKQIRMHKEKRVFNEEVANESLLTTVQLSSMSLEEQLGLAMQESLKSIVREQKR